MKTLDDHNAAASQKWRIREQNSVASNIACPTCGQELKMNRMAVLTVDPPRYRVWCEGCGFDGTAVA